jgi:hypothetical protein
MNELKTDVIAQWNADGTIMPLRININSLINHQPSRGLRGTPREKGVGETTAG